MTKTFSPKRAPIIAGLVCAGVVGVYLFGAHTIRMKNEVLLQKQQSVAEERIALGAMLGKSMLVESSKEKVATFKTLFVNEQLLPLFLGRLEEGAEVVGVGLDIETVRVEDRPPVGEVVGVKQTEATENTPKLVFPSLILELYVGGDFQQVLRFLDFVETLPESATIESYALQNTAEGGGYFEEKEYPWEAEITLVVRSYQPK